jgi:hypothetical protein
MRLTHYWLARLIRDAIAVMALSILFLSILPAPMRAGPFENFFKNMRRAMTQPEQKSKTQRTPRRAGDESANASPNDTSTRGTKRAVASKSGKSDLPYGTPVPGKKGFVTSPYSPDGGFIDVRDFPPGTEVKDPYSGKTFRTP